MRLILAILVGSTGLAACGGGAPAAAPSAAPSAWPSFEAPPTAPAPAPSAEAGPLPRACALVSAAQAEAVLATEAALMADEPESCMWSGSAGVGNLSMLHVTVLEQDDETMAAQVFDGIVGMQGSLAGMVNEQVGEKTRKSGQELDDLGDQAWLSSASIGGSFGPHGVAARQLVVRKGRRLLNLNVTGTRASDGLGARLEGLARSAVPQL